MNYFPLLNFVFFGHIHIYVWHACKRENLNCNIITRKAWNICRLIQHSNYLTVLWSIHKDKLTHNGRQISTQKSKDLVTRTPPKTQGSLMCSWRVSSSCSTNATYVIVHWIILIWQFRIQIFIITLKPYFKHILLSYKTRQMDKTQVVNVWSLLRYIYKH
jgi:hypothetical protein